MNRSVILNVAAALVAIAVVVGAILALTTALSYQPDDFLYDKDAKPGPVPNTTTIDVVTDYNRIAYKINPAPVATSKGAPLSIMMENPASNVHDLRLELYDEEMGLIYTSGLVKPDYHIMQIELLKLLPAGKRNVTARFVAVDIFTHENIGYLEQKIIIDVKA